VKNAAGLIREGVTIGTSGVCIERGGHSMGNVLQSVCQARDRRLEGSSAGLRGNHCPGAVGYALEWFASQCKCTCGGRDRGLEEGSAR